MSRLSPRTCPLQIPENTPPRALIVHQVVQYIQFVLHVLIAIATHSTNYCAIRTLHQWVQNRRDSNLHGRIEIGPQSQLHIIQEERT